MDYSRRLMGRREGTYLQSIITKYLKGKGFTEYYKRDFRFLISYLLEFSGKLDIRVNDCLTILYQKHCITTISAESPSEKFRLYKISLYPEFFSFPVEEENCSGYCQDKFCQEIRQEANAVRSVIVGPELLHWWCHRIIWEAVNVIGYKSLH